MVYEIDYLDDVYEWSLTPDGPEYRRVTDYTPTLYAIYDGQGEDGLAALRARLTSSPRVELLCIGKWRRGFRHDHEDTPTIEVTNLDAVLPIAHQIRKLGRPGEYKCFNVDFSREFRYCLENDLDPTPAQTPSTLSIEVEPVELANPPITELTIDDETVSGSPTAILHAV
nr:hypothetical protein [Halegenticoccus tardaugens]